MPKAENMTETQPIKDWTSRVVCAHILCCEQDVAATKLLEKKIIGATIMNMPEWQMQSLCELSSLEAANVFAAISVVIQMQMAQWPDDVGFMNVLNNAVIQRGKGACDASLPPRTCQLNR